MMFVWLIYVVAELILNRNVYLMTLKLNSILIEKILFDSYQEVYH